jgi:hypothetical protein
LFKPRGHHDIVGGNIKPGFGVNNDQYFINNTHNVALAISGGAKPIEKTEFSLFPPHIWFDVALSLMGLTRFFNVSIPTPLERVAREVCMTLQT